MVGCITLRDLFNWLLEWFNWFTMKVEIGYFGGCTDVIESNDCWSACTVSLQIPSDVLAKVSGSSLALDESTLHSNSYLDVHIWFTLNGIIHNYHMLAITLFEWHTAENMFNILMNFLNVLHPPWKDHLIGWSTDGAWSMTGQIHGLA